MILTPPEKWKRIEPPYAWVKRGLVVIGDGLIEDGLPPGEGLRAHLVEGSVPAGTVLDNAAIFGADDLVAVQWEDPS